MKKNLKKECILDNLKESLEEYNESLIKKGRVQHVYYSKEAFNQEFFVSPQRFYNIGVNFVEKIPGMSNTEYNGLIYDTTEILCRDYPIIFEECDELINGNVYQTKEETEIQKVLRTYKTPTEKQDYLKYRNLKSQYEHDFKLLEELQEDKMSLYNIGTELYTRREHDKDVDYINGCISRADYCFEAYPLLFEFYDSLFNGFQKEKQDIFNK